MVFWKRGSLHDPSQNRKLQIRYEGPFVICEKFTDGTASLRHLHTAKFLKQRVTVEQLKRANHMRQLPREDSSNDADEQQTLSQLPPQYTLKGQQIPFMTEE